jgi:hypothetical protein
MANAFQYDVFLSHSSKDKQVVRASSLSASNGERVGVRCRNPNSLRKDGLKVWFDEWVLPVASVYDRPGEDRRSQSAATAAKIEEGLEHSRVLARPAVAPARRRMLCMSANAFGSDWAACPAAASERSWRRARVGGATCPFATR